MPQKRHGPVDVMSVDRAMLAGTPPAIQRARL